MNSSHDISKSICKNCEFRFRRVFMPAHPEEFILEGDDGEPIQAGDDIVIMNMCLAADMDLDLDSTIECSHYKPKGEARFPFFRHIQ